MSESQTPDRTSELTDLFVSVTGADTVTERQERDNPNRELPDEEFEAIEDGLDDAVDGAEARLDMGNG